MKKLINKKTGEVAFIDLYTNTIYFSKSKTKHNIIISKNEFNQITKITALPQNGSEFISEPIPETKSEPISEPISEMNSEPIINTPSEPTNNPSKTTNNKSNELYNTPIIYSTPSNNNNNKSTFQNNESQISIHNPNLLPSSTSTYKQSA